MLRSGLTNAAIAVFAFFVACGVIRSLLPFPEIEPVSAKLRFFQTHRDQIDTLFLGSSRIYQQLSPALFDEEMRAQGIPTHAFNFGVNGMFLAEESYLLEQILPRTQGRLRWVFIEVESLPLGFDPHNMASERIRYWHDWTRTRALFEKIFHIDARGRSNEKWNVVLDRKKHHRRHDLFLLHLSLFAKNFVNLSSARDIADWWRHRRDPPDRVALGVGEDGFHPTDSHLRPGQLAGYEAALRDSLATGEPELQLDRYTEELCRRCAAEIRRHGAEPVFIVPPVIDQRKLLFTNPATAPGVVLSFNNAWLYPDLYRAAVRIDYSHVNTQGAADFTRHVGERFAAAVRTGAIK